MTVSAEVANEYRVNALKGVEVAGKASDTSGVSIGEVNVNVDFYN